ncbi:MAG: hypothetical protein GWO30_03565 [Gammaproteobacteria bacterium]|nr:hypothetical protein [Gammaproteobacteria bacterium]NIR25532.1 hypothetical protein [Gammaproteobacteria bacterium]NIY19556.1 hypothetical protein [Gammaproteobacteria bacterium]
METDWPKVIEVFLSGIVGVFLVMFLLQVLTQLSTKVIDVVERRDTGDKAGSDA